MGFLSDLLDPLERLITERGSAAVLREHITFLRARLTDQETAHEKLQAEHRQLQAHALQLENSVRELEKEAQSLRSAQNAGTPCDACGSTHTRRTGARPHPIMGDLGIKEVLHTCADCGHVTPVLIEP